MKTKSDSSKRTNSNMGANAGFMGYFEIDPKDLTTIEPMIDSVATTHQESLSVDLCNATLRAWGASTHDVDTKQIQGRYAVVLTSYVFPLSQDWLDEYSTILGRILAEALYKEGEKWHADAEGLFRLLVIRVGGFVKARRSKERLDPIGKPIHTSTATNEVIVPSPHQFVQGLIAGLPEEKERRLIALAGRLDEYREAIRVEVQKTIQGYVKDYHPQKKEQRQRSVDLINGLTGRLGFALEHPDHPGQRCYLTVVADRSNPQGQIRLLPIGSSPPLVRTANLSLLADICVVDAATPIEQIEPPSESTSSWTGRIPPRSEKPSRRKS